MHTILKSLILISISFVANTAVASQDMKSSLIEGHVHKFRKFPYEVPSGIENSQRPFLKAPLSKYKRINSTFGYRRHPVSGKWAGHQGLDYPAPKGTPIRATSQGKISFIGVQNGYGNVIYIEHDNDYSTVYAHQSRFKNGLKKGNNIEQGEIIGYVGSTGTSSGSHLHYELRVNNKPVDPTKEKRQLASYAKR